jgi:hypothetical protein
MEAEATEVGTSQGDASTMTAALESLGVFVGMNDNTTAPEPQGDAPAPEAKASEIDPLDDSLFGDDKDWTPERLKALKDVLVTEKKKANDLRRKAQNAPCGGRGEGSQVPEDEGQHLRREGGRKGRTSRVRRSSGGPSEG